MSVFLSSFVGRKLGTGPSTRTYRTCNRLNEAQTLTPRTNAVENLSKGPKYTRIAPFLRASVRRLGLSLISCVETAPFKATVRQDAPQTVVDFLFGGLFNDALRTETIQRRMVGWLMNDDLLEIGWKRSWPNLRTIPVFSWRDWGKPRKTCHDRRCPGRDSKRSPPECKCTSLSLDQPGKVV
jgi:hypothetical protein